LFSIIKSITAYNSGDIAVTLVGTDEFTTRTLVAVPSDEYRLFAASNSSNLPINSDTDSPVASSNVVVNCE